MTETGLVAIRRYRGISLDALAISPCLSELAAGMNGVQQTCLIGLEGRKVMLGPVSATDAIGTAISRHSGWIKRRPWIGNVDGPDHAQEESRSQGIHVLLLLFKI